MKYRVQTGETGRDYSTKKEAVKVYNNIRALYRRLGYIIADAGGSGDTLCELWIKGSRERNIELYPVQA